MLCFEEFEMILIILDRDGTIIKNNDFFGREDDWKEKIEFNEELTKCLKYINSEFDAKFIIITNQAGIARGYFTEERVEEINKFIVEHFRKERVIISDVQYCPNVDRDYALKSGYKFNEKYVKVKTKRKPSPDMVYESIKKLKWSLENFKFVFVFGDRNEDKELANNLDAVFIDVKNKTKDKLIEIFENSLKS